MNVLVSGFGSIGKRHSEVLTEMGHSVSVVSHHLEKNGKYRVFRSLDEAFAADHFEYIVIANPTGEHLPILQRVVSRYPESVIFIEKPIFSDLKKFISLKSYKIVVGYVLRAHPLLRKAVDLLRGKKLFSCRACCGQHLPDWRPETDYRKCYSADSLRGGGVLRDLSHELDYLYMIAGNWKRVSAIGGKFSDLQISSDDQFGILFETERCPLCICQIDYLSRNVHRNIFVEYENGSLHLDFIAGKLIHNGAEESVTLERNDLFTTMHKELMNYDLTYFSNAHDAYETVKFLDAAEKAAERNLWINNL